MNRLILATAVDKPYFEKPIFKSYLQSIQSNSNFDRNIVICLDFEPQDRVPSVQFISLETRKLTYLNVNKCIQQGDFLHADIFTEYTGTDVIVFTDGDMFLQRKVSEEELQFLRELKHGDVYVGYNASPQDTLEDEAKRLHRTGYISDQLTGDYTRVKVYNTGVLAMTKQTWQSLQQTYQLLFPEVDKMFKHYAKQQWLISYIVGTRSYNIYEMSYVFHNHTHYPSPRGTVRGSDGVVKHNGEVVLFRHKWF